MKKQLIMRASLVAVAAAALVWSGCATRRSSDKGTTTAAPQQQMAAKPAMTRGAGSFEIGTDAVRLVKSAPTQATLGSTMEYNIGVTALTQAAGVLVTDTIPAGATYVKSEPEAQVSGSQLTWRLDNMDKGQTRNLKVWLKADKEGELTSCTTVTAIPQGCLSTFVGRPVLAIEKTGPANARLGQDVTYNIVVRNTGSAMAENVVVTDNIPAGLEHASGQRTMSFNVGNLGPNESKQMAVTVKAAQRGRVCNPAVAKSSNAGEVNSEACTVVTQPMLEIVKTGTKEQFIGKTADYQIVVSNPGDTSLTRVVVSDSAPSATRIVSASGAQVTGNQAVWQIAELKGGEKQSFNVTLTSAVAGSQCNRVSANSQEGLTASSEACTLWKGQAAILIEVVDNPDPILVGESTTYTIRVTNQGTADDTNVKIVANFGKEIDPTSAAGETAGSVSGKTVSFAPVARLAPKQVVQWTISAKGVSTGDHRMKTELTSDVLTSPVTEEESTHVY